MKLPYAAEFLGALALMLLAARFTQSAECPSPDRICGPRCAQFVLEHLTGRTEELAHLATEVQQGQLSDGSSLHQIKQSLERRGLHCMAARTSPGVLPTTKAVVIAHCISPQGLGHFIVWTPPHSGAAGRFWDGLNGYSPNPPSSLSFTGYYLYVSKTPALLPIDSTHGQLGFIVNCVLTCLTLVCILLAVTRHRAIVARVTPPQSGT